MEQPTEIQQRVLDAIRGRAERGEPPPTYRELCLEFDWTSTATARDHLRALVVKGFVSLTGRHRGIRLCEDRSPVDFVPLVGQVLAGVPVLSEQNIEERVPVPEQWTGAGTFFALRVIGDSMRNAGIIEGDQLIVRQTSRAKDGDIVVATLGGETTVKRLRTRKGRAMLVAENPAYKAIALIPDEVAIQGVVVGLQRSYSDSYQRRTSNVAT